MTGGLLATLGGLALVDSTSLGTIGIPIFLIIARTEIKRLAIYLATISGFYFLVGAALLLGLHALLDQFGDLFESRVAYAIQLAVGIGLFALSFYFDPKRRRGKPKRNWSLPNTSTRAVVALALTAGVIEVASMIPYLSAIGLLTASDISTGGQLLALAGYTLVMIAPAVILIGLARLGGHRFDSLLQRIGAWIEKNADGMLSWALGIVGVLLALNAAGALFE